MGSLRIQDAFCVRCAISVLLQERASGAHYAIAHAHAAKGTHRAFVNRVNMSGPVCHLRSLDLGCIGLAVGKHTKGKKLAGAGRESDDIIDGLLHIRIVV